MKEQKKQITLRIPEELCDYCTKIAKERQWSRSDVIWDYIEMGIKQENEWKREAKIREIREKCFEKYDNQLVALKEFDKVMTDFLKQEAI